MNPTWSSTRCVCVGVALMIAAMSPGANAKNPVAFNTPTGEWNIWVSPDENEIIFEASSRPTNVSIPGDLYYSWRTPAGWTAAIPVEQLNTPDSDLASGDELRRLSVGMEPDGLRWAQADSQSRDVRPRLARAETR